MKNTKRDTEKRISPLWIYFQEFMHGIYHKRKSSGGCTDRAGYNENQKYREFFGKYAGHCVLSKSLFVHCRRTGAVLSALPFKVVNGADRV
jgi:hypothetical protein